MNLDNKQTLYLQIKKKIKHDIIENREWDLCKQPQYQKKYFRGRDPYGNF